ncbi:MAG: hypothetical protein AB7G35_23875, partial [Hyphomicrobiaceae bacterium]
LVAAGACALQFDRQAGGEAFYICPCDVESPKPTVEKRGSISPLIDKMVKLVRCHPELGSQPLKLPFIQ